jgi:hypothetical protein
MPHAIEQISYERSSQAHRSIFPPKLLSLRRVCNSRRMALTACQPNRLLSFALGLRFCFISVTVLLRTSFTVPVSYWRLHSLKSGLWLYRKRVKRGSLTIGWD